MKLQIFISTIILLQGLSSCSRDEVDLYETPDMPMTFSVCTGSSLHTRGASVSVDEVMTQGIGVFAFYQKAKSNGYPVDFNKYTGEPSFMSNQQINASTAADGTVTWDYTPHKYWSNNEDDQFTFFAYAPYDPTCAWEDLQISSNLKGDRIERQYIIEDNVKDQKDFMWADPQVNLGKPIYVSSPIEFNFRHLCAKVGFSLGVKDASTSTLKAWDSENTITINEIVVSGVYTGFTYNYTWDGSAWSASMTDLIGSQDISLTATNDNLKNNIVNNSTYTTAEYKQINADDCWLFLAPQNGLKFTIKYTLTKSGGSSESKTKEETQDIILESGKTYIVKILLDV